MTKITTRPAVVSFILFMVSYFLSSFTLDLGASKVTPDREA